MLDFTRIAQQVGEFTRQTSDAQNLLGTALCEAGKRMREAPADWQQTREKIATARTSWLVARWTEAPDTVYALSDVPPVHRIVSADGSQIVPDRHDLADCYVLNVGAITLRYGSPVRPTLTTTPTIYGIDDEMLEDAPDGTTNFSNRRLSIRRFLSECDTLAEMTESESNAEPTLALFDGSLILWTIETEEEPFKSKSLQSFFASLDRARENRVPLVGYISQPQSRDVVNSLRVFACPHPAALCDTHCKHRMQRLHPLYHLPECSGIERVTDARLFETLLKPGERSAVFASSSKILNEYPESQKTHFFYLNTGAEVARIELPAWVSEDPELLSRVHVLAYDQSRKGNGYPLALAEAHELAVIRVTERDAFFRLLERQFQRKRLKTGGSQKSLAKRARRI